MARETSSRGTTNPGHRRSAAVPATTRRATSSRARWLGLRHRRSRREPPPFLRTLGTLLQSGVPILDALDICARTAGNVVIEEGIGSVRLAISEGKNMAEPLAATQIFPDMVVQMIAVGEQTGALDQMLNKIVDFYEEEVDVAVAALTSLLEPLMMVVIGGMVGFMLIAMYMPIFEMAGKVKAE